MKQERQKGEKLMKNTKKGFTIVELVIVIAVIAILAAVLIPTFSSLIKKANDSAAQSELRQIQKLIEIELADDNIWEFDYIDENDGKIRTKVQISRHNDGKLMVSRKVNVDDLAAALNGCADLDGYGSFRIDGSDLIYTTKNGAGTATWSDIVSSVWYDIVTDFTSSQLSLFDFILTAGGEAYSVKLKESVNAFGHPFGVSIPKAHNGKPVTSIAVDGFKDCELLTTVIIPESIMYIGKGAFSGCHSLNTASFASEASTWKVIDYYVSNIINVPTVDFSDPSSAAYILTRDSQYGFSRVMPEDEEDTEPIAPAPTDPDDQTSIETDGSGYKFQLNDDGESYTFAGFIDNEVEEAVIPSEFNGKPVTKIGNGVFYEATKMKSLTIPGSIESIPNRSLWRCDMLSKVIIEPGVKGIGDGAFWGCDLIYSIEIPASVKSIGAQAFYNCANLKKITISSGVESIGKEAFSKCASLVSVEIPASVKVIGERAFRNCESLTNIAIAEGVEHIEKEAFSGCIRLESMELPSTVNSIGEDTFWHCEGLKEIRIPSGVAEIGQHTFNGCKNLTCVTLPSSVVSIGHAAFIYCQSLEAIIFEGTQAEWEAITKSDLWDAYTGSYAVQFNGDSVSK